LPVYPLLAMMAAWGVFEIASWKVGTFKRINLPTIFASLIGVTVLILTAVWAFAFQSIYLRPETRIAASRWIYENVPGPINLQIRTSDGNVILQPMSFPVGGFVQSGVPYTTVIAPTQDGLLTGVILAHATDLSTSAVRLDLSIAAVDDPGQIFASASAKLYAPDSKDPRGPQISFTFAEPVPVSANATYALTLETFGTQNLTLSGASFANETDYDWGLPFRIDGFDPFGGMYRGDLNLQVYWDDNADKLARFVDTLSQTDYIFIPTNHQYAQITRLPERYPLTTKYYRELLGCPENENIIKCYRVAQPGQYQGKLGFELVAVFESYPTLGPLVINDQAAEEAFTFYDHPKVLIFQKTDDFDAAKVQALLGSVDLTNVVHLTPKQAGNYKDLMLPETRLAQQRAGGTWSQLFNYDWIQNKYPAVGALFWYAFIFLLGLFAYPITRLALPGLRQYAYPLSRIVGLALLAWISWMGGSVGVPYTRVSISVAFAIIAVAGISLGLIRRNQFKDEWDSNRRFFVMVEILFLVFFLIDLLIRLGNSDLWHPAKGGERPMDFSYFNAVLKSTSFPPYDPWFAGGYINYYYYGFVLAGTPLKLLGIVPSIGYNFILPTWYALIAIGAFTVAYNLVDGFKTEDEKHSTLRQAQGSAFDIRLVSGLTASVMAVLIGNLGTVQMVFQAFQRIAAPGGVIPADTTLVQRWLWAFKGISLLAGDALLPIGRGDWYWNPSRVIPPGPGNEITEFPLFTFLYSDLHAHMLVMPLTLFIIAWAVSFIKSRAQLSRAEWIAAFGIGALMIGALKPTNTWDLYTFFPFTALAMIYAINRHFEWKGRFKLPDWLGRLLFSIGAVIVLYALGSLMYLPFNVWYSQAYNSIDPWTATHTPFSSYFTQWGLFLFIITAWLAWETREWMASTPVSHLKKLNPYSLFIEIGLALIVALLAFFVIKGARIAWLALPLAVWAGILLLRPNMPSVKRGVLLMIGTGLALTMAVEVIALRGDLGRMNTIFKLYMQVWLLFSVSAAAAFGWLLNAFPFWRLRWRTIYQTGLYILLAGAFMFTITATSDKISDRMTPTAPHTLDSMSYMNYSQHWDVNMMDLSEDYRAIRWMQDNVQGSPVLVEANCSEYRWCTRFTIYTGLPGVIGWNFHQRQQRALIAPNLITDRVADISTFYNTMDVDWARTFLKKHQVKYIIVGQLERNIYPVLEGIPDGLSKFEKFEGKYWNVVYQDKNTTIYEVLP
jgi:YYY domain-containing protein